MTDDLMQYQKKLDHALRGVVRAALIEAATDGLPGEHHFYITFRTKAPGVEISKILHTQYEEEMTIVLQHQFWGLETDDDGFRVTLSFDGVSEPLVIPWDALIGFLDPEVEFGLRFGTEIDAAARLDGTDEAKDEPADAEADEPSGEPDKTGQAVAPDGHPVNIHPVPPRRNHHTRPLIAHRHGLTRAGRHRFPEFFRDGCGDHRACARAGIFSRAHVRHTEQQSQIRRIDGCRLDSDDDFFGTRFSGFGVDETKFECALFFYG